MSVLTHLTEITGNVFQTSVTLYIVKTLYFSVLVICLYCKLITSEAKQSHCLYFDADFIQ